MAVDLDAIRKKIQQAVSGQKKTSAVQLWKPKVGEYRIRCLPWPDALPGEPIKERSFYFLGDQKSFLVPSQFGKDDPIERLRMSMFQSKQPDEKALAKTLFPKTYGYLPIIDRDNEDAGVQLWKFGKTINLRLLGFFVDEDCGDFLDPIDGNDLKISVTQAEKKKFLDFTVDFRAKKTPLSGDAKRREEIIASIPNLDDLHPYAFKTPEQIEGIVNAWLNGDPTTDKSTGTERGGEEAGDELENLSKDLNESSKSEKSTKSEKTEKAATTKKASSKKVEDDLDEDVSTSKTTIDLDGAFKELMSDED